MYRDPQIDSLVDPAYADALYRLVRYVRPKVVLEVGMAHGGSSLAILTALEENQQGRLLSVDPNQHAGGWTGVTKVSEAGLSHRHQLLPEPDYLALPELVRSGVELDLAYIDGWHTFDYTLLDFFYIDKMLHESGIVGFNDCHYPSVERVLSFVARHRKYDQVDVGLVRRTAIRRRAGLPLARWTGRRVDGADQYFRKVESWEPDFKYWADF